MLLADKSKEHTDVPLLKKIGGKKGKKSGGDDDDDDDEEGGMKDDDDDDDDDGFGFSVGKKAAKIKAPKVKAAAARSPRKRKDSRSDDGSDDGSDLDDFIVPGEFRCLEER